jgi:hypothetical protein
MGDFLVMSILKGFGTATLYIVLGLYMTSGFPLNIVMHAGGMMILVRSDRSLAAGSLRASIPTCCMQLRVYHHP